MVIKEAGDPDFWNTVRRLADEVTQEAQPDDCADNEAANPSDS